MPMMSVAAEDAQANQLVDKVEEHVIEVVSADAKTSKKGDSLNRFFEFKIVGGAFDGASLRNLFNSKFDKRSEFTRMLAAFGVPASQGGEFDSDILVGERCRATVVQDSYDNETYNTAKGFKPLVDAEGPDSEEDL